MAVWALRMQLFISGLVFLYVGASVLLDPEGQTRATLKSSQKSYRFTLLEAVLARIVGAYCFGLGTILQALSLVVHDRLALLVTNYGLIVFYSLLAYMWYYWIGIKLKGANIWEVDTCNFNAGGYAFFVVFTISCVIAAHLSSPGSHHKHHGKSEKKD